MRFESSVNSDGTQTNIAFILKHHLFESSVNSDGTQTACDKSAYWLAFESSVNSDGTQTQQYSQRHKHCLRVV